MGWKGRRKQRERGRRILFATDVHGSDVCFRKFINSGKLYEIDYLILGGDITLSRTHAREEQKVPDPSGVWVQPDRLRSAGRIYRSIIHRI